MVLSPFPPEVFMPLAGFMAAEGELNVVYVVLSGVAGFLLSILPWYFAGKILGETGLKKFQQKHPRWLALPTRNLEKANRWFYRHRGRAVLFSLLVPGIRNLISVPAGMSGMQLTSFLLYTTLGSTIWLSILTLAGYFLGSRYYLVEEHFGRASNVIIAVLGIAIVIWIMTQVIRSKGKYR
ncbi:MAG: DedA family protein [Cyanobacteria bacterium CRU_2_1]|nr:DedA family protein [Cyanobacteria bacterium CRU_2_1]